MPVPPQRSAFHSADIEPGSDELLSIKPNHPFLFAHFSENWEQGRIGDQTWWMPQLHQFSLEPGTNGVETRQKGRAAERSYERALAVQARRGVQIIPTSVQVPVEDADGNVEHVRGYRVATSCRHPDTGHEGTFYADRWMEPKAKRPNRRQKFHRDTDGYNRWRLGLIVSGTIAPPADGVVDERLARLDYHRDRHAGKLMLPEDTRAKLVEAADEKVASGKAAKVPEATGTATAAPKPAWARKTIPELAAALKAGQADLILDEMAKDKRKGVRDAVASRRKALQAEADDLAAAAAAGAAAA